MTVNDTHSAQGPSRRIPTRDEDIKSLENLANWMDSKFTFPGTNYKFGLDPILGLIPGVGDTMSFAVAAYIIGKAGKYDVPAHIKGRMIWNAFLDWLVGLIPFFGDIFDARFKANKKNVALLLDHLHQTA